MAADVTGGEFPSWLQNVSAAVLAMIGTLGVAHVNRRASDAKAAADREAEAADHAAQIERIRAEQAQALQNTIDARIRIILADDEKTIKRLERKIDSLEGYIRVLIAAIVKAGMEMPPMPKSEPCPELAADGTLL